MTPALGDSSFLLWVAAALVVFLGAYLFIGWVRRGASARGRQVLGPVMLAALALGLGISSAMILSLSAGALAFPLGYRWVLVPVLALGPVLAVVPAAWWLTRQQNLFSYLGVGLMLAVLAVAVQAGWVYAAGLRPGVTWKPVMLGLAAGVQWFGCALAFWLSYSSISADSDRRSFWRLGAAAVLTLSVIAGEEIVGASASVSSQVGSIYLREAAATWLCLGAGALVPVLLAMLALDLALRNRGDRFRKRRSGVVLNLPQRRKRRRKYRAL